MECNICGYKTDTLILFDKHMIYEHLLPKTKCAGCTQYYVYDEEFHQRTCKTTTSHEEKEKKDSDV